MHSIRVDNVNQALAEATFMMLNMAKPEDTRNGPCLVAEDPFMTTYENPRRRVLFSPMRDANPFFHFFEALWMLAGRNDVEFPQFFNKGFAQYSDDGRTFWGAYGWRWRRQFGYDQLALIVKELKTNPNTRRAVLAMWDASGSPLEKSTLYQSDLQKAIAGGKDVPCNTHAYLDCRGGKLNVTVCCRSNDMLWGAYGSNVVHFSMLQEVIAGELGISPGVYRQFSNNFHVYTDKFPVEMLYKLAVDAAENDQYLRRDIQHFSLYDGVAGEAMRIWWADLEAFFKDPLRTDYASVWFYNVVRPMYRAWYERKVNGNKTVDYAAEIMADDWRIACMEWIRRRNADNVRTVGTAK